MSEPESITINDVRYVREDSIQSPPQPEGGYVIVRCRNAGVHAGYLIEAGETFVKLANSRRLWRWWSKFTLSGLATDGPLESHIDKQKYACPLAELTLITSDVCEIIPRTERARLGIQGVADHENA